MVLGCRILSATASTTAGHGAVDQRILRSCLGTFATGVCVVTVGTDDGRHGITVNSFASVSLSPPLVLVSIDKRARGHRLLRGRPFAINVLGAEQEPVARHFAGDPQPAGVCWEDGARAPCLAGSLATLECVPWRDYDGGDHTLFLGRVVGVRHRGGDGLAFFFGRFATIAEPVPAAEHLFG
jgi:flavin reductase (DIM6/NTAB) family NADH-FMN oxidoreductase RutF